MKTVAVLFARKDSIYKTMEGCDVWDIDRDARNWPGGCPIIGHPPCRAWGALGHIAKPRPDEKALAPWCIEQIRKYGGVLEHPRASKLWPFMELPEPDGKPDKWGGFTILWRQYHWGHLADKPTKFYICGIAKRNVFLPFRMGRGSHTITTNHTAPSYKRNKHLLRPELLPAEREKTPPALAQWLVDLARRCTPPTGAKQ
jgi:hypothetical protein